MPPQNSSEVGPDRTTRTERAVLVAEESDGAHLLGLLARRLGRLDRDVGQHGLVRPGEDLVELLGGRLCVVREVEAQVVGRHQRALLAHVVAEHRPQRGSATGASRCDCAGWPRGARRRWWPARPARPAPHRSAAPGAPPAPAPPTRCRRPRRCPTRSRWSRCPPPGHRSRRRTACGPRRSRRPDPRRPSAVSPLLVLVALRPFALGALAPVRLPRRPRRHRPRAPPAPAPAPRSAPRPGRRTTLAPPHRAAPGRPPRHRHAWTWPRRGPAPAARPWRHRSRAGRPPRRRRGPAPRSAPPGSRACRAG